MQIVVYYVVVQTSTNSHMLVHTRSSTWSWNDGTEHAPYHVVLRKAGRVLVISGMPCSMGYHVLRISNFPLALKPLIQVIRIMPITRCKYSSRPTTA